MPPPSASSTSSSKLHQLEPGAKLKVGNHECTIISHLSEGGFAHIYKVQIYPQEHHSDIACLKRVLVKDKSGLAQLRNEVRVMQKLIGCPNIVQYYDSHASRLTSSNDLMAYEVLVLMELCPNRSLLDFMNSRLKTKLSELEILKIMYDISLAVAQLHYLPKPLIHRDIKIENVLLDANHNFKLCDFGSTTYVIPAPGNVKQLQHLYNDILKHTTPQYRSPEMVDLNRGLPINEKSDIWALGVFLYKLCYYITPFETRGVQAILTANVQFPMMPQYSDPLRNLILIMLHINPNFRPNIFQVIDIVCKMGNMYNPLKDIYKQGPYYGFEQLGALNTNTNNQYQQYNSNNDNYSIDTNNNAQAANAIASPTSSIPSSSLPSAHPSSIQQPQVYPVAGSNTQQSHKQQVQPPQQSHSSPQAQPSNKLQPSQFSTKQQNESVISLLQKTNQMIEESHPPPQNQQSQQPQYNYLQQQQQQQQYNYHQQQQSYGGDGLVVTGDNYETLDNYYSNNNNNKQSDDFLTVAKATNTDSNSAISEDYYFTNATSPSQNNIEVSKKMDGSKTLDEDRTELPMSKNHTSNTAQKNQYNGSRSNTPKKLSLQTTHTPKKSMNVFDDDELDLQFSSSALDITTDDIESPMMLAASARQRMYSNHSGGTNPGRSGSFSKPNTVSSPYRGIFKHTPPLSVDEGVQFEIPQISLNFNSDYKTLEFNENGQDTNQYHQTHDHDFLADDINSMQISNNTNKNKNIQQSVHQNQVNPFAKAMNFETSVPSKNLKLDTVTATNRVAASSESPKNVVKPASNNTPTTVTPGKSSSGTGNAFYSPPPFSPTSGTMPYSPFSPHSSQGPMVPQHQQSQLHAQLQQQKSKNNTKNMTEKANTIRKLATTTEVVVDFDNDPLSGSLYNSSVIDVEEDDGGKYVRYAAAVASHNNGRTSRPSVGSLSSNNTGHSRGLSRKNSDANDLTLTKRTVSGHSSAGSSSMNLTHTLQHGHSHSTGGSANVIAASPVSTIDPVDAIFEKREQRGLFSKIVKLRQNSASATTIDQYFPSPDDGGEAELHGSLDAFTNSNFSQPPTFGGYNSNSGGIALDSESDNEVIERAPAVKNEEKLSRRRKVKSMLIGKHSMHHK